MALSHPLTWKVMEYNKSLLRRSYEFVSFSRGERVCGPAVISGARLDLRGDGAGLVGWGGGWIVSALPRRARCANWVMSWILLVNLIFRTPVCGG